MIFAGIHSPTNISRVISNLKIVPDKGYCSICFYNMMWSIPWLLTFQTDFTCTNLLWMVNLPLAYIMFLLFNQLTHIKVKGIIKLIYIFLNLLHTIIICCYHLKVICPKTYYIAIIIRLFIKLMKNTVSQFIDNSSLSTTQRGVWGALIWSKLSYSTVVIQSTTYRSKSLTVAARTHLI